TVEGKGVTRLTVLLPFTATLIRPLIASLPPPPAPRGHGMELKHDSHGRRRGSQYAHVKSPTHPITRHFMRQVSE
ncbi:hypothetical protein JMJ77_0008582, partial [Colletotrichum scovillei]